MALSLSIKQKIYFAFSILVASALLSALVYQRMGHNLAKSAEQNTQLIESLSLASQSIEGHIINAQHLVVQSMHTPLEELKIRLVSSLNQVEGIAHFMSQNIQQDEDSIYGMSQKVEVFILLITRMENLAHQTKQQFNSFIKEVEPTIKQKVITQKKVQTMRLMLLHELLLMNSQDPQQSDLYLNLAFEISNIHLAHLAYLNDLKPHPPAKLLEKFNNLSTRLKNINGVSQKTVNTLHQQALKRIKTHQANLRLKDNLDTHTSKQLFLLIEAVEEMSQAIIVYNEISINDFKQQQDSHFIINSSAMAILLILAIWVAWRLVRGIISNLHELKTSLIDISQGQLAAEVPNRFQVNEFGDIAKAIHKLKLRIIERKGFELSNDAIKQRMQSLLINAPVGLIEIDQQGIIVLANGEIQNLLNYSENQLLGKRVSSILGRDFTNTYKTYREQYKNNKKPPPHSDNKMVLIQDKNENSIKVQVSLSQLNIEESVYIIASLLDVTALYQAQQDAMEQKSLLEEIINDAPEAMIITTPNRSIKIVNPAFSYIFGYSSSQVVGKKTNFLYKDEQEFINAGHIRYNPEADSSSQSMEISYLKKDGSMFLSETVGGPIRDKKGELIGYMAFVRDISQRKASEKKLSEYREQVSASNHRLKIATQSVNMGVWDFDIKENKLHWNDEMFSIFGSDENTFNHSLEDWAEKVHPQDIDETSQQLTAAIEKNINYDGSFRIIHPHKGIRHISAHTSMSTNKQGEVVRVIGVNWDQTDQVTNQAQLKQLALVASSTNNGVIISDESGVIKWVNDAFIRISGYSLNEALGKKLNDFMHGKNTDPDTIEYVEEELTQGRDVKVDILNYHKDGHEFWVAIDIQAIKDQFGKVSEYIEVQTDITHKKIAEEELHDAVARSELLLISAEQANIAKSEFLANMSHEIRTPMNGVLGMLNLLIRTDQNPQQQRYSQLAHNSAESLLVLINDILDFSKIEAGKLELEYIDFDLLKVISEFSDSFAYRAHEKELEYIVDMDENLPNMVNGDPSRIRQIITNLCGNALKFTNQGEIKLSASQINKDHIRFEIKDTGIGIPNDKVKKLFQKFTQADGSTTRQYGGTGLGLSISKQLCDLMGGEIGITSIEGEGSTFWFTIKLAASTKTDKVEVPHISLSDTSILVIDDNQTNREVIGGLLTSWGANVDYAELPHLAFNILKRAPNKYRVVILDMQMPEEDGLSLLQRLLDNFQFKHCYFLLMSSVVIDMSPAQIKALGLSGVLNKPVINMDLHKALAIIIDHGKAFEETQGLVTQSSIQVLTENNKKLLLVEDNLINQEVAKSILEEFGYSIDTAENGEIAINMLNKNLPYAAVLMDCQMPIMDGYQTTHNIRQGLAGEDNKTIPIIAMTANAMKGDREKCLDSGMDDYLAKPLNIMKLEEKLKQWIKVS